MKTKIIKTKFLFFISFSLITLTNSHAQWVQQASMLGSANRNGAVSWTIGNKGYVVGGGGSGNLQEYDPVLNTWTIKAPVPWAGALAFSVSFVINGKGYVCTGQDAFNNVFNDLWEYNPVTNTWAVKAQLLGSARTGAFGFSIGNKGYVIGGADVALNLLEDVWEYDAITDSWNQKSDFGNNGDRFRVFGVGTSVNGFGFAGLGFGIDNFQPVFIEYKDFWKYDPALDLWTQVSDIPGVERQLATIASSANRIYIGLGSTNNFASTLNDFYSYDPLADLWNPITSFSSSRENAAGFFLNNALYFSTGTDFTNFFEDLWKLDVSTGVLETKETQNNIRIFPNPCGDYFYIDSPKEKFARIVILNCLGEEVISYELNTLFQKIDVSSLPSGIYFAALKFSSEKIFFLKINIIK